MSTSVRGTDILFNDNSTQGTAGFTGGRNRIINGDMRVNQRNIAAQVPLAAGVYLADRWIYNANQSTRYNAVTATATPPVGFTSYLSYTSTGAFSPSAGDWQATEQRIEGLNFSDLNWGSVNAKAVTLSFVVKSSLTGTFSGAINNADTTRSYPFTFTISSANTWETKTVIIPGDTTGTWRSDNGTGASVRFNLGTGTTYLASAGAWTGAQTFGATGSVNVSGTSGASFHITGVQLEAGSVASPFERRDYGRELIMCQRYYSTGSFYWAGGAVNTATVGGWSSFPVTMRSAPTLTLTPFSYVQATGAAATNTTTAGTGLYAIATGTASIINIDFKAASEL